MAEEQHGVFTVHQARAAGLTEYQLVTLIGKGVYERVLPTVLAVAGSPRTWSRSAMAAQLWAGESSALSHESAARAWGLSGFPAHSPIHVSTTRRLHPPRGIAVHCCDEALLRGVVKFGSFRLTSGPRTIMDLAGKGHLRAERALDHFLREGIARLSEFWTFYESDWVRERRGIRRMRGFLVGRTPDLAVSDSDLEDLMWGIIREYALPYPQPQFPVQLPAALIHVDFAYPNEQVAIECDGYAIHMDRDSFERDRVRDNELQAIGWVVLRFTWSQVKYRPGEVAAQIRLHLERRRADHTD